VPAQLLTSPSFASDTVAVLAQRFTSYSLDPSFANTSSRLELVTLFESLALARDVASTITTSSIATALSISLFGTDTGGVKVFQAPKTRTHRASSFVTPMILGGWGMNITSVAYNRSCTLENAPTPGFESIAPPGGCWQVEMIYMGGQELRFSDESSVEIKQSKNVLYLPRIERNPDTLAPLVPAQTLTMSTGTYFPCDVTSTSAAGAGLTPKATACCLRSVEATYCSNTAFASFLNSASFNQAVPLATCASASNLNDTFPQSDIVFELPTLNGEETNDLVVGHIEGMPSSEVRLLETIDYTTRTFRVMLVLEEGDLRNHASMTQGITGIDYNMTFFVGLANFKGTNGGSVLNTMNVQQYITVSKSNELTISTFGANQDPLISSETMQLKRIKVTDYFNPVQYLYYLQVCFFVCGFYLCFVCGHCSIDLSVGYEVKAKKVVRLKPHLT